MDVHIYIQRVFIALSALSLTLTLSLSPTLAMYFSSLACVYLLCVGGAAASDTQVTRRVLLPRASTETWGWYSISSGSQGTTCTRSPSLHTMNESQANNKL